jgi:hypothetical protein
MSNYTEESKKIYNEVCDKYKHHWLDTTVTQTMAMEMITKALAISGVGSSNKVDYKQGFELAQKYIEESPCDPDIYRTQLDAWNDYQQFLIDNNIT